MIARSYSGKLSPVTAAMQLLTQPQFRYSLCTCMYIGILLHSCTYIANLLLLLNRIAVLLSRDYPKVVYAHLCQQKTCCEYLPNDKCLLVLLLPKSVL